MIKKYFSKHGGDLRKGYSYEEALIKRYQVNEAFGVGQPMAKWNGAVIEQDPDRKSGYRVSILEKED